MNPLCRKEGNNMFDMRNVGFKISELRKTNNMTQMELADRMGISFQAVSNWERGNSMPDISKLPELAQLFNVTIDEILGERSELIDSAANDRIGEYLDSNTVTLQQLADVAPILKAEQVDMIFEKDFEKAQGTQDARLGDVIPLLPFLSNDTVNALARKAADDGCYKDLHAIAPFAAQNIVDEIARKMESEGKSIAGIVPFISDGLKAELAESRYRNYGLSSLADIAPFISEEQLQKIAEEEYEKWGVRHFNVIAPFLNSDCLNGYAKKAVRRDGLKAISGILPFLDRDALSEYVKEKYL